MISIKIIPIFAEKLYAFQYDGEVEDEYFRLLVLWTNNTYLQQYAKANNIADARGFVEKIISNAEYIDDLMTENYED